MSPETFAIYHNILRNPTIEQLSEINRAITATHNTKASQDLFDLAVTMLEQSSKFFRSGRINSRQHQRIEQTFQSCFHAMAQHPLSLIIENTTFTLPWIIHNMVLNELSLRHCQFRQDFIVSGCTISQTIIFTHCEFLPSRSCKLESLLFTQPEIMRGVLPTLRLEFCDIPNCILDASVTDYVNVDSTINADPHVHYFLHS